jgi:glycogen debranching enzyme
VVRLATGPYLAAGGNQFRSLWTRDFAFAARGLMRVGRLDVVQNHLEALIRAARPEDGLVPRTLDSHPIALRVALGSVGNLVHGLGRSLPLLDRLRAQYLDEHGSPAIDSNLLVLLTAIDYARAARDRGWWSRVEDDLVRVYRFYDRHRVDGLIRQPRYSDWQDSVRREGHTFYTNLLYYTVSRRLQQNHRFAIDPSEVEACRRRIISVFLDPRSGLFLSLAGHRHLSLDGNLLAIDLDFFEDPGRDRALYRAMVRSELWRRHDGLPGFNTTPDYPRRWVHGPARLARLCHYHDRIFWSWLMALSAKVADRVGDEVTRTRVLCALTRAAHRDGTIAEIYAPLPRLPKWRSWIYRSETPFSWGAGMILDALAAIDR